MEIKEVLNKLTVERNIKRDKIQQEVISDWVKNDRWGMYVISMGLGKGKIIADTIKNVLQDEEALANISEKSIPILIQVSSEFLRDVDTMNELIHWGISPDLFRNKFIQLVCYQSSSRWRKDKNIGLLVSDEVDFSSTENYGKVFKIQKPVYSIALSGTFIESKEEFTKELEYFPPVRFKYPVEQAQADGIINKTKIIIHEVPLYTKEDIKVTYKNKKTGKPDQFFTSEQKKYEWVEKEILIATIRLNQLKRTVSDEDASYSERNNASYAIPKAINTLKYLQYSSGNKNSRANLTYTLQSLTDYTIQLKNELLSNSLINIDDELSKDNKVIIFGKFTDIIDEITPYGFHGKKSKDEGDEIVNRFNFNELREIGVVKKANRGINFKNLNHCIGHTFTSSETDYLQGTKGRMTRLPIHRNAYIHILYSYYYVVNKKTGEVVKKYCQNKSWADAFLTGESNDIYTVNSIEDSIALINNLEKETLNKIINENK